MYGPQKIELTPIVIADMQVHKAEGPEKNTILKRMQTLSAELGTKIEGDGTITIR